MNRALHIYEKLTRSTWLIEIAYLNKSAEAVLGLVRLLFNFGFTDTPSEYGEVISALRRDPLEDIFRLMAICELISHFQVCEMKYSTCTKIEQSEH